MVINHFLGGCVLFWGVYMKLLSYDAIDIDDSILFFCNSFNALIEYDINKQKSHIIDIMPEEEIIAQALVSQLIQIDGKIILIPLNAKKIWLYDINTKLWSGIDLYDSDKKLKFLKAVYHERYIYILPCNYNYLVKLNVTNWTIDYLDIFDKLPIEGKCNCHQTIFRSDIAICNQVIFAASCFADVVLKYNMRDGKYEWIKLKANDKGFSGIAFDGIYYWISDKVDTSRIYRWDGENKCEEIAIANDHGGFIRGITVCNNSIYVKKNNETVVLGINDVSNEQKLEKPLIFMKIDFEDKIFKQGLGYDGEYFWSENGKERNVKFTLDADDKRLFFGKRLSCFIEKKYIRNEIFKENEILQLRDFVEDITDY